jgi:hypothetical protein
MEKKELNLNNPIFTFYLNVENRSPQEAIRYIEVVKNNFDIYNNVTMWFIASKKDEVVCVYDGWGRVRDNELKDLIEEINEKIDIMSNSQSFDDFKINVRDWRLKKLINEE